MSSDSAPGLPPETAIRAVAALDDVQRRSLYAFSRRSGRPVTRDEAATALGISRKLAAFHLDKLVAAGLLRAHYEPVGGLRRVGRTPKVYEPDGAFAVSIPARHHDALAEILVAAVATEGSDESAFDAALRVAATRGHELGARERDRSRPGRLGAERALALAENTLTAHGFEPARDTPTRLRLRNCPFHPLAAKAPQLVCAINHAFLTGFVAGLQAATVRAVLIPTAGECCVRLQGADHPA